jgi:Fe-S oxidoreductase
VINLKTETGVGRFQAIAGEVADLVVKYGGALSGEHGDGLVRSPFQEKMFGPALYQAFRDVKRAFDPFNVFNPGKIIDAPPLTANLRYGPAYVTPEVATTFDFSNDGGMVRAAELCAGVGECRKQRGGIMCPSFQATREEQHSTRGRANALRLALTGQLGLAGLTDPTLQVALDLCLECKACKSECPTNVDMARLKAEFLHQFFQKNGLPWRNRIFGNLATLSQWGSRLAPVSSWLARHPLGRWLNEKLFGIERRRLPPAFVRRTFVRQFAAARAGRSSGKTPGVLLFPDTFTNFHQPALGMAVVELLSRAGVESLAVDAPGRPGRTSLRCCGRPMISNGLLSQAVEHARHNVELLYPPVRDGWVVIACEPSCILTIKDDYPALLRGDLRRQAEAVATACFTFEDLLVLKLSEPGCSLRMQPGPKRVLVQAHCHQRSLVGTEPTLRLLRCIPGAEVVDLDAGCCGMAGSFGYEKEHYDVSRLVGEHRLFPALRQAAPETTIVAPGFSCRMQIEHFTGREALHPAELLLTLCGEMPDRQ